MGIKTTGFLQGSNETKSPRSTQEMVILPESSLFKVTGCLGSSQSKRPSLWKGTQVVQSMCWKARCGEARAWSKRVHGSRGERISKKKTPGTWKPRLLGLLRGTVVPADSLQIAHIFRHFPVVCVFKPINCECFAAASLRGRPS